MNYLKVDKYYIENATLDNIFKEYQNTMFYIERTLSNDKVFTF